jgi:hypothetical protein
MRTGSLPPIFPMQNIVARSSSALLLYVAIGHTDWGVNIFQQSAIARLVVALINNK